MKLRIQENSLRLRLTQKEVSNLRTNGRVECAIRFSAERALRYAVFASPEVTAVKVLCLDDSLEVQLPSAIANAWANSGEVTIEGLDSGVRILVEKDFQCLHDAEDRDPDGFPNPSARLPK